MRKNRSLEAVRERERERELYSSKIREIQVEKTFIFDIKNMAGYEEVNLSFPNSLSFCVQKIKQKERKWIDLCQMVI